MGWLRMCIEGFTDVSVQHLLRCSINRTVLVYVYDSDHMGIRAPYSHRPPPET